MADAQQPQKAQDITRDHGPLKSAIKGKQTQSPPKRVRWDHDIVDNEHKMLPRGKSGATHIPISSDPCQSPLSSSTYDHLVNESIPQTPEKKTRSPHRHQAQAANTSTRRKSPPADKIHETTLRPSLHVESHSSRTRAKRSNEHRIPPSVPEAPHRSNRDRSSPSKLHRVSKPSHKPQDSLKPPPTPRPWRLPSPDLPEIGFRPFCECCETQAHSYPWTEVEYFEPAPQKWELQLEKAFDYIASTKRGNES